MKMDNSVIDLTMSNYSDGEENLSSEFEEEIDEFLAFVKEDLKPLNRTIHLASAKQKFDLKKISSHGNFASEIFTYITAVVGLIIALIIT